MRPSAIEELPPLPGIPSDDRELSRPVKKIRPPSFAPTRLFGSLRDLMDYWDLFLTLSLHRLKVRYKQSLLGWAWAVLQPLSLMVIYTVIFSVVTRVPSEGIPYSLFVYSALLPWTFFSTVVGTSATSLVSHTQLITKVYFPREILPLTYLVAGLFDFLIAAVILAAMMLYHHIQVTLYALYLIPIMGVLIAFSMALALFLSALQVRVRDIGLAMPLVMQLWMFATPVVYPLSQVPARFRSFYILNPLVGPVEGFRRVLLQSQPPDDVSLRVAAVISLILLPISYLFFKHREASMADII
jgi:lipopolysaccharide transport system permease protein